MPVPELNVVAPVQDGTAGVRRLIRTGIVIDASCDVSPDFLADPDVAVIPIPIRIGQATYVDQHNPEATSRYMRENANGEGAQGQSAPLDAEQMRAFFMERFALDYDSVYCLTITASRSPIHDASSQGSAMALNSIRDMRQAADIRRPFQFRVIDTKNMFAGSGIPAMALRDMLLQHMQPKDIRDSLFRIIDSTYTYYVPDDLRYARTRSRGRGDRSINLISAMLGGALDIKPIIRGYHGDTHPVSKCRGRAEAWGRLFAFAAGRIAHGLHTPHLIVSYAGPLQDVRAIPQFAGLRSACEGAGVSLHVLQMSITGMMNIGPGGLTLAFAGPAHGETP
ncbi:fatty acid-binding protein DegV [Pseudoxanthomonas broegbernensis]|uniref:Fatty acid-binding protein DegV n=1 Tax=Pseudoxanthomonas broegbernensis TaxID=83619 RepID=A0A7V8GPJ9_9GAMM|nr:DegV family protein [Pseudoxanthomonas broegbernensis]KAF1687667.1 fatty acid-binding protein DegV [Pseudoxanthomonas broegbernensis]MBB6064693.1 DegV family protein with EDD domain [Pseudoxanthomonas broegbernensis]